MTGFDNEEYLAEQTAAINERVAQFSDKLYLEFGGKLLYDFHAARVLPGFDPNVEMRLLQGLSDKAEVLLCIYAGDIERKKMRANFGIAYDSDALKLIDDLERHGAVWLAELVDALHNGTTTWGRLPHGGRPLGVSVRLELGLQDTGLPERVPPGASRGPMRHIPCQSLERTDSERESQPVKLKVATCQFPVGPDTGKNLGYVLRQMKSAKERGAHVAHFSEVCLPGYAGVDIKSMQGFDWDRLHDAHLQVAESARKLKLWVVVGSAHRLYLLNRPQMQSAPIPCGDCPFSTCAACIAIAHSPGS